MKKSLYLLLIALLPLAAMAQKPVNEDGKKLEKEKMETKDYLPEIHGTVRGKYEYQTDMGAGRFQTRNARFSATGNLLPIVAYKIEMDFADEGVVKAKDIYARVFPTEGLQVTAGQMRVPFTIDAHRGPHAQHFSNRSFIAKNGSSNRDVGMMIGYKFPIAMPLRIDAGLFNADGLSEQKAAWNKHLNYSAKMEMFPVKGWNVTFSAQSFQPNEVRINTYDIGTYVQAGGFHIEAEYLYKTYADNAFDDTQAFNAFINYDLPLKKVFRKISFQARYDMMTAFSDGKTFEDNGKTLTQTRDDRKRLTGGITFSLGKAFQSDIRLNYEKYFYDDDAKINESEQDKLVMELSIRF